MKMKKYKMLGGGTIKASSPKEIVGALRFSSLYPMATEEIFVLEMSQRCKFYNDAIVRTDTIEHFVEDLIRFGFIWEVENV